MNTGTWAVQSAVSLHSSDVPTILRVGLVAGTLDIADALIWNLFRGITPTIVFQHIASGLIGVSALGLGLASVVLGVLLHYSIALIWTAIFCLASRKVPALLSHPVVSGLTYGVWVYIVMNFIVLPLSALPSVQSRVTFAARLNGVLALMFCIGLTISLLLRREHSKREPVETPV